jgi:hypothetical protein
MGLSLKPIVGMPDGYYSLDLALKKDRSCFSSLIEQSEYMKLIRIRQSYEGKVELRTHPTCSCFPSCPSAPAISSPSPLPLSCPPLPSSLTHLPVLFSPPLSCPLPCPLLFSPLSLISLFSSLLSSPVLSSPPVLFPPLRSHCLCLTMHGLRVKLEM